MLQLSAALNTSRLQAVLAAIGAAALTEIDLQATLAFLDDAPGNAQLAVYEGARGDPLAALLVTLPLAKPAGAVTAGQLLLAPGAPTQNLASGQATWARLMSASGALAAELDVSDTLGTGEIKLETVTLFVGGETALVSGVIA